MTKASSLSIILPAMASDGDSNSRTPLTPNTPHSPLPGTEPEGGETFAEGYDLHLRSPISVLPVPPSPKSPKHKTSKSLFPNYKASKSSTKLGKVDSSARVAPTLGNGPIYRHRLAQGSSPELSLIMDGVSSLSVDAPATAIEPLEHRTDAAKDRDRKRDKHKFPHILGRKGSIKDDDPLPVIGKPSTPTRSKDIPEWSKSRTQQDMGAVRTAPLEKERGFRSAMSSAMRNRSLDRNESEDDQTVTGSTTTNQSALSSNAPHPHSHPNHPSSSLFHNIKSSGFRAADGVNRARKGLLGKLSRNGGVSERDMMLREPYQYRVVNLPLIEQTRITRISKRLEKSKDKTEFWMPALPWRCIDYLNLHGTTSEGLYRIPGSEKDVRYWTMRFDKEHDINLFDQEDLYDVNTVSSMFKQWLRHLPDYVFPSDVQQRIIARCANHEPAYTSTPQYLKDEISNLPPWNYYLLFAITCHISLLHNCSKDNKMNYSNLVVCFAPCLKVDQWIFQWLILDWKNCWQGCNTERDYLEKEYAILDDMERSREIDTRVYSSQSSKSHAHRPKNSLRSVSAQDSQRSTSSRGTDNGNGNGTGSYTRPLQHFDKVQQPRTPTQAPLAAPQLPPADKRNISSSESSKPSITGVSSNGRSTPPESEVQGLGLRADTQARTERSETRDRQTPPPQMQTQTPTADDPTQRMLEAEYYSIEEKRGREKKRPPPMEEKKEEGKGAKVAHLAPELSPLQPLSPIGM
ncbi:hypothetical protein EJ06DRAFT_10804 [Trichodelitschia bisporula]|uniref:Rho-GAP domain-containing protein n=1 Tax=Trichodelitschia bisporula TaxID=703511 RepID=A0A6G1IAH4_9PEZI|nr:hypothetical protein EJ06DRAFT_10804 [Trichodelitschia bisporula]